ncbi:type I secretion C-terminal target domain-containing protein [Acinetobacter sp. WCHA55]|nr:type I secretion C-terminal target domain-containing protein [Acinetobacter sp. WCHA55]
MAEEALKNSFVQQSLSRPLNAEDEVDTVVSGDTSNNTFTSDATVSELFVLNGGQDILKLIQNSSGETLVDYVSDFKVTEDKLDLSEFLDSNHVNSSNIQDYLGVSYDADLKTNTVSVRTDLNGNSKDILVLTNQSEYLSVQDLLINQAVMY